MFIRNTIIAIAEGNNVTCNKFIFYNEQTWCFAYAYYGYYIVLSIAYRKCTVAAAYDLLMQGLPSIGNAYVAMETVL